MMPAVGTFPPCKESRRTEVRTSLAIVCLPVFAMVAAGSSG